MFRKIVAIWVSLAMLFGFVVIVDVVTDITPSVEAATLYVNETGSGGAFTGIQDAINAANPGDTVFVYNGTYYENVVISKIINLIGEVMKFTIINGSGSGDVVKITENNVNISGFTIIGSGLGIDDAGLKLENVQNGLIFNINASNNGNGIYLDNSDNNVLHNNTAFLNHHNGIYLYSSDNNKVIDNNASFNREHGIYMLSTHKNNISRNNASYNFYGFYIGSSYDNNITDNSMIRDGIIILGSKMDTNNINTSNTVNGRPVVFIKNQVGITAQSGAGQVIVYNCSNVTVEGQVLTNGSVGILLVFSSNCSLIQNNVSNNYYGIYIIESDNNYILGNEANYNELYGIYNYCSSNNISDNSLCNNMFGLYVFDSRGLKITGNNASFNIKDGIAIYGSGNHDIINNIATYNYCGIYLWLSSRNNLYGNIMVKNGIILWGFGDYHWENTNIDITNTVNGKPVYYLKNQTSGSAPTNAGQLILYNCTNVKVENLNISDSTIGIEIGFSSEINVIGNNLSSHNGIGLFLESSYWNNIFNNNIGSNKEYGIYLQSSVWNNITINDISQNGVGLYLKYEKWGSRYNMINGNILSLNEKGIFLNSSKDNTVFHNQFINNTVQTFGELSTNNWDNGYPSGGNFWSDYIGEDYNQGPDQNISGSDGIGDNNYSIDPNTIDRYPLLPMSSQVPIIELISPENNSIFIDGIIIDFDIWDRSYDIIETNYSINSGQSQTFTYPFDINTTGWPSGNYIIEIHAEDDDGNIVVKFYNFTIDSLKPIIILNNPNNNSCIPKGTILDFILIDPNLLYLNYSINDNESVTFPFPYNISTAGWIDGEYIIDIYAVDLLNNTNNSWFVFKVDSTKPTIQLLTPLNNSYILGGTILDIYCYDEYLDEVNYSVNGNMGIILTEPYDIPTNDWPDGEYWIQINAIDLAGNSNSSWFLFTIDSTKPLIYLDSPNNNSIITQKNQIEFTIVDPTLISVNYSINGGNNINASEQFNISTQGWPNGEYTILINALDILGNLNSSWFIVTIDSSLPNISIDTGLNHSSILPGRKFQFNISDPNLNTVMFSIDNGDYILIEYPYTIDTTDWTDGIHVVSIKANDSAENERIYWFEVNIDGTSPFVVSTYPMNYAVEVDTNITVTITFSEPMNKSIPSHSISISPLVNVIYQWNEEGTILSISFDPDKLAYDTTYTITLDQQLTDESGNALGSDSELIFTTQNRPEADKTSSGISLLFWILGPLIVLIVIFLIYFLFIKKKRGIPNKIEEIDSKNEE